MARSQNRRTELEGQPANLRLGWTRCALLPSVFAVAALACQPTGDPASGSGSELRTVADCPPGYHVIEGTERKDVLLGTRRNDCILGNAGNDWLFGFHGDDYLVGGPGKDVLIGGSGADELFGEGKHDALFGGPGGDFIRGGGGKDLVFAGVGDDVVRGDDGNRTVPAVSAARRSKTRSSRSRARPAFHAR